MRTDECAADTSWATARGHRTHAQPQPPKKDIFFWRGILLVKMAETSKVFFFWGGTFSVSWKKKQLLLEEILHQLISSFTRFYTSQVVVGDFWTISRRTCWLNTFLSVFSLAILAKCGWSRGRATSTSTESEPRGVVSTSLLILDIPIGSMYGIFP